jgi:glutaredoxin-like YruB-family protein
MENIQKSPHRIRVFSTPSCPYCITLKAFLDEKGFQYEDINVAEDEQAREEMIQKSGQMGVPVVEIDGQIIIGFDKERISQILGIKD